jgi:hypothetical protein
MGAGGGWVLLDMLVFRRFVTNEVTGLWQIFIWFMVLVMAGLVMGFGKQLLTPTVQLEATDRGLVTYWRWKKLFGPTNGKYDGEGLLIPWERIEEIELRSRVYEHTTSSRVNLRTIDVRVRQDEDWVFPEESNYYPEGTPDVVHIDALYVDLGGKKLLEELQELHRQYGGGAG